MSGAFMRRFAFMQTKNENPSHKSVHPFSFLFAWGGNI
jgi:hypothetical protein